MIRYIILFISIATFSCSNAKTPQSPPVAEEHKIITGAEQVSEYLPLLKDKKVAFVVNQTSVISKTHLVDSLLSLGVKITKIFAPEHGFRGDAANGEHVQNSIDKKTNLPLISIYGSTKKPSLDQLKDVDIIIFDIQDVGARFYTYISTMHYIMESCAENNIELIILDRPNPNGDYIDGPIIQSALKSFVGMHPIPIVHGLTVGELALMINGEKWLDKGVQCKLKVIKNKNYSHKDRYSLPIKPSPNLPNDQAIRLYPSICLFEGTLVSVGRGTPFPFQVIGLPDSTFGTFTFTPITIEGVAKNPPQENKRCYGLDLRQTSQDQNLTLKYLIDFYNKYPDKKAFFIPFFDKLAGTPLLKEQIKKGMSENEIKTSWKQDLDAYKQMRKKYLLYQD